MFRGWLVILLMGFVTFGSRNAEGACTNIMCSGTIKKIVAGGTIQVQFNGFLPAAGLPNCTSSANTYLTLSKDPDKRKEQYAMLLSAFTTGSNVIIRIIENSVDCEAMYTSIF